MSQQTVAGAGPTTNQSAPAPGSAFGVPKYSTQRRFVPDNGNENVGITQVQGAQKNVPTTRLDQLDIVTGIKAYIDVTDTWTAGGGKTLTISPFYPAALVQSVQFKLQAAYNTFNLTGPLAAIIQAYRPMWGSRGVGLIVPDVFANPTNSVAPNLAGTPTSISLAVDIPFAIKFDEYYDLSAQGDPTRKLYDAIVTPMFMAAQARVVVPTIIMAPGITSQDLLGGPVTKANSDTTSTFTEGAGDLQLIRDAFWTASNPAGNPPQFPWLYTRDYFTQPTNGQGKVGCLIQNTGVSVGQVLSLFGFVWDPQADGGLGAVVPFSSIQSFEIVTGGSLQNYFAPPEALADRMRSLGGNLVADFPSGVFVFDLALSEDGSYLFNSGAINTYLVNGVQLNIVFKAGLIPSATSTVYVGVEALKLATS
jgi:hypothetical protein